MYDLRYKLFLVTKNSTRKIGGTILNMLNILDILKKDRIKYKKNIRKILSCLALIFLLFVSLSYNNGIRDMIKSNFKDIFTAKTDESSTSTNKASTSGDMVDLLARLINGEARGEPYEGQVAVGAVVLNRVKSSQFPNTISSVIYQANQFSCIKDGQFNKPIDKGSTVYKAAQEAINGSDPSNGALFFYNPKTTKSKWLYSLKTIKTIGKHVFAIGG